MSLPNTYKQLDFIGSTGTQIIDTNYISSKNTKIECDFQYNSTESSYGTSDTALFGTGVSGDVNATLTFNVASSNFMGAVHYNYQVNCGAVDLLRHKLLFNDESKMYLDDVYKGIASSYESYSNSRNLYLFRNNQSNLISGAKAKIFTCKIYDNGTLVRDFIPVIRVDDKELGLYDLVNDVFYTNKGTGKFYGGYDNINLNNNPLQFKVGNDVELQANFKTSYQITINYDSSLGNASYEWGQGSNVILTASPNANAQFLGWYIDDTLLSTQLIYEHLVSGDTTFEARFERIYDIELHYFGDGTATYVRDPSDKNLITITATPSQYLEFSKFSIYEIGSVVDYFENPLTARIHNDIVVTTYFEYAFEWIQCITDRTQNDIINKTKKGYLNIEDLNRIEKDCGYLISYFGLSPLNIKANWVHTDYPKLIDFTRIINNLQRIKLSASSEGIITPDIPTGVINNYIKVNTIETILQEIYDALQA